MTGTAEMVAQEAQTALETAGHAATIRDFRHARYAIDGADVIMSQ